MRALALGTSFVALSGCSLMWNLNGLDDRACDGACVDGASYTSEGAVDEPPAADATAQDGTSPSDSGGGQADGSDESSDGGLEADVPVDGVAVSCTPPTPPSLDDCTGLVSLATPPVIDGVLDCGVPLWPMPIAGVIGPGPLPSSVGASLAIAWRPNGLYVFVHVTGAGSTRYPAPAGAGDWCGDAVELFVDDDGKYANPPGYDNPGTIQLIVPSPSGTMTTSSTGASFRDGNLVGPYGGQFTAVRTSDGFDLEAFVVASDLGLASWTLTQGASVGLDVAVDLGDPSAQTSSCPRLGQFTIQLPDPDAACNQAACNVGEFCAPRLGP